LSIYSVLKIIFAKVSEFYDIAMWQKGSKFYSIFNNKCPRCHEGEFFSHRLSLRFGDNLKIHEKCSSCGLKYMIEPSFFYGAMYVSYALTVAFAVAVFIISSLIGLNLIQTFIAILVSLLLLLPWTMRLSRLLYINMFVHYGDQKSNR